MENSKHTRIQWKPFALGVFATGIAAQGWSQLDSTTTNDEVFELSPFEVSASSDTGYRANETLAGTRFKSQLKDVPSQINVMTKEFLDDIAAVDVNEAFNYSANVENDTEYSAERQGFNSGIVNVAASGRIRGISRPGKSRDFFYTNIPRDSYNIDRITISSGPNAILFGNTNPGGVVNTAFIRANATTEKRNVTLRTDNYGSLRGSFDVNQPIIEDRLGIRVAGVYSDQNYWQEPHSKQDKRVSVAAVYRPTDSTTIRAFGESMGWESVRARPTRVGDMVTPWIEAGRPGYDNSDPNATIPDSLSHVFTNNGLSQPIFITNSDGETPYISWQNKSVLLKGPGDQYAGVDRHQYSLPMDESIFPYEINLQGDATRNNLAGDVYGAIFEQKLFDGLYLELAYNREDMEYQSTNMVNTRSLSADANMYLPDDNLYTDNPTPNPNFGRYYIQSTGSPQVILYRGESEEMRAQLSYELDFTDSDGAIKWLGTHRLAGMMQRSDIMGTQQYANAKILPNDWTDEQLLNSWRTGGGGAANLRWRAYVDDPNDPNGTLFSAQFPFDSASNYTYQLNDEVTYWGGAGNPWGGNQNQTLTVNRMDSKVFALQSLFLDGRVVFSYGKRKDDAGRTQYQLQNLAGNQSGRELIYDVPLPDDFQEVPGGKAETIGGVVHVFPWLSLFYNESSTWNVEYQHISPLDGTHYPGNIGNGKDYGIAIRLFDNKVSLKINKYTNVTGPDWNTPARDAILPDVQTIERILYEAYEDGQTTSQIAKPEFFDWEAPLYPTYNLLSDKDASGYEFNLTANPTKNWRLTLNGSVSDAISSNVGPEWVEFVNQRAPVYAQYSDLHDIDNANDTVADRYLGLLQGLNMIVQSDGQALDGTRAARANFVTRYSFTDGRFDGLFMGGGARWRDKSTVGYKAELVDNQFPFDGAPEQILVPALDAPIYGDAFLDLDAFIGYKMKLGDKVDWRIQLNVRNLLDDRDPVAQRVNQEEGFVSVYRIPEPRSFILTNSFDF